MKKIWKIFDISLISFLVALVFFIYTMLFFDRNIGIIGCSVTVSLFGIKFFYVNSKRSKLLSKVKTVSEELNFEQGKAFERLTVPCTVVEEDGTIIWLNDSFSDVFGITYDTSLVSLNELVGSDDLSFLFEGRGYSFSVSDKHFSVFSNKIELEDEVIYLLYFFNQTELKNIEKEYYETRPSVMLTVIDNASEIYQSFKESDCTAIFSKTEHMIDDWAVSYGGLCRKFSNARMLIFIEERGLRRMIKDKFSILEDIRNFTYDEKSTDITLSIGIGKSDDINQSNEFARQALDMAQSRGGDQVAIKKDTDYTFYGGVSAGFEKRNKVRTRLISKTIAKTIADSDNVLIMGHRFSDFDSFGSCVGMYAISEYLGKTAHIVVNEKNSLAKPLIESFKKEKGAEHLISPENAADKLGYNTLLIITDTHKKNFTESEEIVDNANKIMIIDHHRKSVGYIEDTVMFYHMPNSSSASEMVSEISQYIGADSFLGKFESTALLSGIMLDTRNFILRSGVRTFESAAYLRARGANTVECKKLFSNDMELFRHRNSIIDMAEEYRSCAISIVEEDFPSVRLATSQAADEMLNIEEIKASFVIFPQGECVNISARSYGEINVQLIMESLGGGGHQTMSACQFTGIGVKEAEDKLKNAINDYYNNV